ncbi:hypothetical protein [Microbacterium hydrocarbonoxydans]|uniref:hypothetical protein n=1 Tax=Microbacterium hydrocarbonoxydans TaxID=273678 RepID=UPI0020413120|nr:hypothetical protein [Microbacterium hydrocarbonoxydans]MCM3778600.1 hypothetical protein [Microbacterium hydrocarbonoxydans]
MIQLDAIAVAGRAHAMTLSSRVPDRTGAQVDDDLWGADMAMVFEAPVHAASLVTVKRWPHREFRRASIRDQNFDWAPSDSVRAALTGCRRKGRSP